MKKVTTILVVSAFCLASGGKASVAVEPASPPAPGMPVPGELPAPPALPSVNGMSSGTLVAVSPAEPPGSQNAGVPPPPPPQTLATSGAAPAAGMGGGGGRYGAMPGAGMAAAPPSGVAFQHRLQSIIARAGGSTPAGPLLILSSEIESQAQANLEEDMTVMAHLLQRALGEAGGDAPGRAMGVNLLFAPGTDARRDLYIQGYGAVFVLRVPYPLLGQSGGAETTAQEPAPETEWEQARRELMGQPLPPEAPGGPAEPYREEKVNRLTQVLLEALKNANNIRELKPDDSVTVCAIGPAASHVKAPGAPPRPGAGGLRSATPGPRVEDATVLTIRLTKADIESFAKGKVDLAGIRKKARIAAYACSTGESEAGYGAGGFGGGGYGAGGYGGGLGVGK